MTSGVVTLSSVETEFQDDTIDRSFIWHFFVCFWELRFKFLLSLLIELTYWFTT